MNSTSDIFEQNGPIASVLDEYAFRPQQAVMADSVDRAIEEQRHLLVEAGAGVGKTFAYLVPLIEWTVRKGRKAVISTYTKNLQNQIYVRDLPFLKKALGKDLRYSLSMGARNYVCRRKAESNTQLDMFDKEEPSGQTRDIVEWIRHTRTGLVTDMDLVPDHDVWSRFSRDPDMCGGKRCPHRDHCFYWMARRKQAMSHLIVTNHHMLFTDLVSKSPVLPEYDALVLDEAHTVEDVATTHFGARLDLGSLKMLCGQITEFLERSGGFPEDKRQIMEIRDQMLSEKKALEDAAGRIMSTSGEKQIYDPEELDLDALANMTATMTELLQRAAEDDDRAEQAPDRLNRACAKKCARMHQQTGVLGSESRAGYVHWAEKRPFAGGSEYVLCATPVDISGRMRSSLFEKVRPVILTSATLNTSSRSDDFGYIKKTLGLEGPIELITGTPFDHKNNVMLYLPSGIADPRDHQDYVTGLKEHISALVGLTGGGMFVLFTNYRLLHELGGFLSSEYPDKNILKQGDMPRYVIMDVFRNNPGSVLLGTTSFWQGVDIPGEALKCVVITRLPFAVPTDPVTLFRSRALRDQGLDPFRSYQMPRAIIMFKQGFGRLIRSSTDRGVVAVLDPRIRTRRYGSDFLKAIPKCAVTSRSSKVKSFLQK